MKYDHTTTGPRIENDAIWFREKLGTLKLSQTGLAQWMKAAGDDRQFQAILRSIQRVAGGDARVSGELRVILKMLAINETLERQLADAVLHSNELAGLLARHGISVPAAPISN